MEAFIPQLVTLVSGGVVVLQALIIAGVLYYLFLDKSPIVFFPRVIANNLMSTAFVVTLGMVALTLFFEFVAGFEPCMLCWWQRVFMFPQIMLLGIALWKNESAQIMKYCFVLSFIGLLVGAYHYLLLYIPSAAPCSATGPSCATVDFIEFGYVTFPLWAVTGFALLMCLLLLERNKKAV